MMKQSLMILPAVGWTNVLQGSLFLKRDWEKDNKAISAKLSDMEENRYPQPFWIGIYPEGTRITPAKKEASQKHSREKGYPILEHVLLPRTKGFVFIRQRLKASVKTVYDVTIAYAGGPLYLSHFLLNGGFKTKEVHCHIRRIQIDTLPTDGPNLEQWLRDIFAEKDKQLSLFAQNNQFRHKEVTFRPIINDLMTQFVGWAFALSVLLQICFGSWGLTLVFAALSALAVYTAKGREPADLKRA